MKILFQKIIFFLFFAASIIIFSQSKSVSISLPVVSLLNIEPTGNITLNFTPSSQAGNPLTNPTSTDTKWLNYTSALTQTATSRTVTASISQTIPGINIKLTISNASGGAGVLGIPSPSVTLSTTPIVIITGIRGAYTGIGINYGHRLTFSAEASNYANITASNTSLNVVYTISD